MQKVLIGFLIIAVFLEGIITSFPLVLVTLILLMVTRKSNDVFTLAFFAGILLDIFHVHAIGLTSIFFLVVLMLIFMYERKYEVGTLFFTLVITSIAAFFYFLLFPTPGSFIQGILAVALSGFVFSLYKFLTPHTQKGGAYL